MNGGVELFGGGPELRQRREVELAPAPGVPTGSRRSGSFAQNAATASLLVATIRVASSRSAQVWGRGTA